MKDKKDTALDSIVDFIDDDEYYYVRKFKQDVENAKWSIYIFSTLSALFYVIYIMMNVENLEWINVTFNILLIAIYFCLAAYCSYKPFTALVATLSVLVIVFLLEIFLTSTFNFRGIFIKIIFAVYISMRLNAAKRVQDYENKHPIKK